MNHPPNADKPGDVAAGSPAPPASVTGLGRLLRDEAAQHEPDIDRILTRMSAVQRDEADKRTDPRPRTGPLPRAGRAGAATDTARGRARGRLAWPVAAAGVTVLTVATVAAAHVLTAPADGVATVSPAVPTSSSSLSTAVSIAKPTPSGSPSAAPSKPTGSAPDTATAGQTQAQVTSAPSPLSNAVSITVAPKPFGASLTLPGGARDWIAVGSRKDGVLVRAKDSARALGTVTVSGYGPSVVDGPYQVSWSGGVPEQDRAGDITWQSITAVDGRLRITVPLKGDRFTVDLYAGTVKTTGRVQVEAPGGAGAVSATVPPCSVDVCADVVSVTVDSAKLLGGGASGDLVIDLGPARPGVGLGLGLAAVVLR
jgi:hypothetical protein